MKRQPALRGRLATASGLALFAGVWLLVGFASGTVVLLGPVRWLTSWLRGSGFAPAIENAAVIAVIASYVAGSCAASVRLARWLHATTGPARWATGTGLLGLAAGALWLWMTPAVVNSWQPVATTKVASFTFGPYPERDRFEQLSREGYTAVVTLLHPTAVPFEAVLLARERALAAEFGIELIEAPMLPWISGNEKALAKIRELAARPAGRYYVHCYLVRDRVGVVQRLVERAATAARVDLSDRDIRLRDSFADGQGVFERGPVFRLDEGVYLTPYPTEEEMLRYFLAGDVRRVVSLLDPDNPEDRPWIDKERRVLEAHGVPFAHFPVPWLAYRPELALQAARAVREGPRPVIVHAFRSTGLAAEMFRFAYLSDLPPVSRELFREPMAGGLPHVLGVNVVIGPRPVGPEFGTYLYRRGIRAVLWVGDDARTSLREDRIVVRSETTMRFETAPADAERVLRIVATGGPWYVYGPGAGRVQGALQGELSARRALLEADARATGVVAARSR